MDYETRIKDLTILLLHLTSWDEKSMDGVVQRSWKGYPWEALDSLEEDGLLMQTTKKAKSVYLTDEGVKRAEKLKKKLFGPQG